MGSKIFYIFGQGLNYVLPRRSDCQRPGCLRLCFVIWLTAAARNSMLVMAPDFVLVMAPGFFEALK
jgi:hypothetical protein